MRALCIENGDTGSSLVLRQVDDPSIAPQTARVRVLASALNRADLRRASVHFAASQSTNSGPAVGGLEMAGEVVEIGEGVDSLAVGDRVMAMTGGSWAEQVVVDHRLTMPIPAGFDWSQAAATPISFITAFDALSNAAHLAPGETVLVQGASSAAGIATVQLGQALGARAVLATSTKEWKLVALRALGCHAVSAGPDVLEAVRKTTEGHGADVIIDIVGQGVVQQNIDAAAVQGRIVCLGRLAGVRGEFDLDEFARKRITMKGVTFRTRTAQERIDVVQAFNASVLPLLQQGLVKPVVDRAFPLSRLDEAEAYMRSAEGFGKVIITVAEE